MKPLHLLGVDASVRAYSVALFEVFRGQLLLVNERMEKPSTDDLQLIELIQDVVNEANLTVRQVDGFALGIEPFSSRVGQGALTLIRALALANRKAFLTAPSLAAMAFEAAKLAPVGSTLVPLIQVDAKLACGFYRVDTTELLVREIRSPEMLSTEAFHERIAHLRSPLGFGEVRTISSIATVRSISAYAFATSNHAFTPISAVDAFKMNVAQFSTASETSP